MYIFLKLFHNSQNRIYIYIYIYSLVSYHLQKDARMYVTGGGYHFHLYVDPQNSDGYCQNKQ